MGRHKMLIADRLWPKIARQAPNDCWLWQGKINAYGYGVLTGHDRGGSQKTLFAHRLAFELPNGITPNELCVLHRCDVRACCNPAHLFLGTRRENAEDRDHKGRTRRGILHSKAKLSDKQVIDLRKLREIGLSWTMLAQHFKVSASTCRSAVGGRSWKHVP